MKKLIKTFASPTWLIGTWGFILVFPDYPIWVIALALIVWSVLFSSKPTDPASD